ncbi:MAG TPA: STAS domain-containing protein [Acidimicrobiales bacterium]|nr:STAS domain-containing protein [Acidimicrobiales bacterium]
MSEMLSFVAADEFTLAIVGAEIDLANATELFEELWRGIRSEARGLIVDLSTVRYVDSAGVQSLFDVARELHISRQHLGIVVPQDSPICRLVEITRLDDAAVVANTVDACVLALRDLTQPPG